METPIELTLVGFNNGMYQIKYPNLDLPIEINEELYRKFCKSRDYVIKHLKDKGKSINDGLKQMPLCGMQ
ncbi:MAG: hypothetical protein CL868_17225 [Cytophagaceae bacterium]|nr:hypothetical protein [Cytophagaceae bacterium]|tara:strand:+ start:2674 stop:2883 length:210 start_codon:yes stop_codon:yes gene_type:complete